jgi:hypothetical protein
MGFGVMGVFFVGFDNKIGHGFGFKLMCSAKASHTKFFKRKKGKKESQSLKWRVSKKQVFLKKYYPIYPRNYKREIGNVFCSDTTWVEIFFKNPQGLNLLF